MIWLLSCTPTELPADPPAPLASTAAGAIEGVVLDADGAAVVGAAVTSDPGGLETTTDEGGGFSLARVTPDAYTLVVAAEGWQTAWSDAVTVEADTVAMVEVTLSPAETLDGLLWVTVSGPDGAPWSAEVTAGGQTATTDSTGTATLPGLGGQTVDVEVVDPTGRLLGQTRTVAVPVLGGEALDFRLAGLPAAGTADVGSTYCGYCHGEIGDQHAESAHGQGLTAVDAVTWESSFEADGLVGGPLRGAVPYLGDAALSLAWIPDHPERGEWSGGAGGEIDWTPPAVGTDEADCLGCHTSPVNAETEGGVSCERCHGSGREHAYATADRTLSITNPRWLSAEDANAVCAECHSATALTTWPSGAAAAPHAQSDELAASGHGQGVWSARCTDCHDPHTGGLRLESTDNSLCLSCHEGLDFADEAAIKAHTGHPVYQPQSAPASGRCTGCHMPQTAAELHWNDETGGGDLASHLFVAVSPAESVADFDDAGAAVLSAGAFTPNACSGCHAWNDWLFDGWFPGPSGDPTLRDTHEGLRDAYEDIWP